MYYYLVEVSQHSCWGFIGDFDGGLQDALGDDVTCSVSCWFGRYIHSVGLMTALTVLLKLLVQLSQPLLNKVNILEETRGSHQLCTYVHTYYPTQWNNACKLEEVYGQ